MNSNVSVNVKKPRESNFELARIVSMICIVWYHLFWSMPETLQDQIPIFKGIQMPLHFGVLLFVMISGYFGIKPTIRGGGKLLLMVLVYFLPLTLIRDVVNRDFIKVVEDLFVVSYARYWFFRDYLFLYLLSPIINTFLKDMSDRKRAYSLIALTYIAIFVGSLQGCSSLAEGKNIVNFMLLYTIGDTLRVKSDYWQKISYLKLITVFLSVNSLTVTLWMITYGNSLNHIIWVLSYPYCSPVLYFNALLVFVFIGKFKIQSRTINYVASSMFAVYLIHYNPVIFNNIIRRFTVCALGMLGTAPYIVIPFLFIEALAIIGICVIIDKSLSPLWNYSNQLLTKVEKRLATCV